MKFPHQFGTARLGLAGVLAVALATSASAQDAAPSPARKSEPQITLEKSEPLITLERKNVSVRVLLQQIDEVFPQKILIGEGVQGRLLFIAIKDKTLDVALDRICMAGNLTWGRLDRDTIVVLPARVLVTQSAPSLSQVPRLPGRSFTIPTPEYSLRLQQRPDGVPESAKPREFNGLTYYIIPMASQPKAEPGAESETQQHDTPAQK